MLLFALMLGMLGWSGSTRINDYPALKTTLVYEVGGENLTRTLQINYSQLHQWRAICTVVSNEIGTNSDVLVSGVLAMLTDLQYPEYLLDPALQQTSVPRTSSHSAVQRLIDTSLRWQTHNQVPNESKADSDLFLLDNRQRQSYLAGSVGPHSGVPKWIDRMLHPETAHTTWLPPYLQRSAQSLSHHRQSPAQVILYQTIGANTGGTTAMYLLHRTLHDLGYSVLICNGTNRYSVECTAPDDRSLIVTGEWCHEVFAEYVLNPSAELPHVSVEALDRTSALLGGFKGRGVQYYLGFHHAQDSCRGSAAVTDCHYLSKSLGTKGLSAYYLGCAMADHIKNAFEGLVSTLDDSADRDASEHSGMRESSMHSDDSVVTVQVDRAVQVIKEDLILVDPDFFTDYPPYPHPPDLQLPAGYKYLYAKGYTPEQMVLLLQRAKIVLDLGMPGPERLSTECVLMGCIPIISNRWTGASQVDYPGVHRVDHQNVTQLALTIAYIAENYESELSSMQQGRFCTYALSMWSKVHQTTDIVIGSSYLHFVLYARDLQAEYGRTFQILALLYLYPLCSVDLYVTDVVWFMRHHYAFFELLQQAGYVCVDPLDPCEFALWNRDTAQSHSFVRIKLISTLDAFIHEHLLASAVPSVEGDSTSIVESSVIAVAETLLSPAWPAVVVVVAENAMFRHPSDILVHVTDLSVAEYKIIKHTPLLGGSDVSDALVLAPECTVTHVAQILHNMMYASPVQIEPQHGIAVDTISVCALYEQTTAACVSPQDTVCGVVNTAAWQSNLIFAKSLGYNC